MSDEIQTAKSYILPFDEKPPIEEQKPESIEPILNEMVNQNREMYRLMKKISSEYSSSGKTMKLGDFNKIQQAFLKGIIGLDEEVESGRIRTKYAFHLKNFVRSLREDDGDGVKSFTDELFDLSSEN